MKTAKKIKICVILFVITAILFSLYRGAATVVYEKAKAEFSSYASLSFYKAVAKTLSGGGYDDILDITKDKDGFITYVGTNSLKVNLLTQKLSESVYNDFSEYLKGGVPINLGAFTGIRLLSAYGSETKVKLAAVANVFCELKSVSKELSVNQTRNEYYLVLRSEYTFVMPYYAEHGTVEVKYMLYDFLVVGKVPSVYLVR